MGKIWSVIFTIIFLIPPVSADEGIRVSAPPSIWARHQGGKLTGPAVDLITDIFTDLKIDIVSLPMSWARAMTDMKSGKLDMVLTIFHTEERAQFMAFSTPYVNISTVVFVLKGNEFFFNGYKDLMGKQGLMQKGDSFGDRFDALIPRLTITGIVNYKQILKMLITGRGEYAVAPKYGFIIEAKRLGYENKICILPRPIDSINLHFALSKKSPYLKYLPMINEKIKKFQEDGTIKEMVRRAMETAVLE